MIYNETATEVYIAKQERIKPDSSNNHNTDRPDTYLDKPKQEIKRKDQRKQEVRKTEIMKKIAENGEINVELVLDSPGKRKTNGENQQGLEKRERNDRQHDEETTVQKEQDNVSEILISKEMKIKENLGNDELNLKVNSISQVKKISN